MRELGIPVVGVRARKVARFSATTWYSTVSSGLRRWYLGAWTSSGACTPTGGVDQATVTRFVAKLDRLDFAAITEDHLLNETDARELGPGNSDWRGEDPPAGPGPELWPRVGYGDFTTRYLYDADIPGNPTGNPYGLLDGIVTNQTNPEGGAIQVTTDITTDRWGQLVRNDGSSHENEVDVGSNWMGDVKTLDMAVGSQQVDTTIYRDRWGNAAVILRSNQDLLGRRAGPARRHRGDRGSVPERTVVFA